MLLGKAQNSMLSYQLDKNGRTLCLNHFWTTYAYVHSHTPKKSLCCVRNLHTTKAALGCYRQISLHIHYQCSKVKKGGSEKA